MPNRHTALYLFFALSPLSAYGQSIADNKAVCLSTDVFEVGGRRIEGPNFEFCYFQGHGQSFKKLESLLYGKTVGYKAEVTLKVDEAYGAYKPELRKLEDRSRFPKDIKVGGFFEVIGDGINDKHIYVIKRISGKKVEIDGNHPLVGKALRVFATVTHVREPYEEEVKRGFLEKDARSNRPPR